MALNTKISISIEKSLQIKLQKGNQIRTKPVKYIHNEAHLAQWLLAQKMELVT